MTLYSDSAENLAVNGEEDVKKANGYELLVVWELDYTQDPQKVIQQCKAFLHG